jgi:ferric-dicitrate binding protein FerR (iron transport regulator)
MHPNLRNRLDTLLTGLRDEQLTPEEVAELERLVLADAEARRWYVRLQALHAGLHWLCAGGERAAVPEALLPAEAGTAAPSASVPIVATPPRKRTIRYYLAAAAVLLAFALPLGWWAFTRTQPPATVTRSTGVGDPEWQPGAPLRAGPAELPAGLAELAFSGGTRVLVEGPAKFEVRSPQHLLLHSGRAVVQVPPEDVGFLVETARARLLDLGTEFGVSAADDDTTVQVFAGAVEANWKQAAPAQRLVAGQAVRIGAAAPATPEPVAFAPHRFIRFMPVPPQWGRGDIHPDWLAPRNASQFDAVDIRPAPPGLVIDGDLTDWPADSFFSARCEEPFDQDYHVRAALRYDRDFLYIAAHVADPEPMRSVVDPDSDPMIGWKGGSAQLRLSTDRKQGWPVRGEWMRKDMRYTPEVDFNDKLVHVTMWYYEPAARPCLYLEYGMNLHSTEVNPPGWRGAFHRDADGRGYALEYAIPWNLLHAADDPPQPGDVLGACLLVHWSDSSGRLWRGHLTEIRNPAVTGVTHLLAPTWGRAVYHR